MNKKPRDVAVVRVSEQGDRDDEHFHSPEVQLDSRQAVDAASAASGLSSRTFPEIDVSGQAAARQAPRAARRRSRWSRPARPITSSWRISIGSCAR